MLLVLLVVLLLLAIFGGWGYPRYGAVSASPFAIILVIVIILWLSGAL